MKRKAFRKAAARWRLSGEDDDDDAVAEDEEEEDASMSRMREKASLVEDSF